MTQTADLSAFGKNDIRGIYGENVTEELFYYTGRGFVKYVMDKTGRSPKDIWIAVPRDARLHSEPLAETLIKGIVHSGANALNLGIAPTPLGYYSEFALFPEEIEKGAKVSGALIVTASHNPPEYNGLKMTFNKSSLNEAEIQKVKEYTREAMLETSGAVQHGRCVLYSIIPQYFDFLSSKFFGLGKGLKIVTDCANGTAGTIAPKVYKDMGCEVIELFTEPDGHFPNHHPNPSDLSTLETLRAKVIESKADLGLAFDGDSDRLGIVDSEGNPVSGDKLLFIYAQDIIKDLAPRGENPVIVSEVKCSQVLYDEINRLGGRAVMAKTGHGYIKSKMKEENAVLAGEMSGHMFFKDRYYGFDDAVYAGCRIIEIAAERKMKNPQFKISDMLEPFNKVYTSDEVRYKCPNELKKAVLEEITKIVSNNKDIFKDKITDIITIDGLRIIFSNGFALIRQSNTEPVFTLRFEASDKDRAENFKNIMISLLDKCMLEKSDGGEK